MRHDRDSEVRRLLAYPEPARSLSNQEIESIVEMAEECSQIEKDRQRFIETLAEQSRVVSEAKETIASQGRVINDAKDRLKNKGRALDILAALFLKSTEGQNSQDQFYAILHEADNQGLSIEKMAEIFEELFSGKSAQYGGPPLSELFWEFRSRTT